MTSNPKGTELPLGVTPLKGGSETAKPLPLCKAVLDTPYGVSFVPQELLCEEESREMAIHSIPRGVEGQNSAYRQRAHIFKNPRESVDF